MAIERPICWNKIDYERLTLYLLDKKGKAEAVIREVSNRQSNNTQQAWDYQDVSWAIGGPTSLHKKPS